MALTAEQRRIAEVALRMARARGAPFKVKQALIEAGLVESDLRNLNYGDADSLGYLQQRPSMGWPSPTDITTATKSFLDRAMPIAGQYSHAGDLAQAVQRSRFPERYRQRAAEATSIIHALGGGGGGSSGGLSQAGGGTRTIPGVDNSGARRSLLANYFLNQPDYVAPKLSTSKAYDPLKSLQASADDTDSLINLATRLKSLQDIPGRTVSTGGGSVSASGGGGSTVDRMLSMAKAFDRRHSAYLWGGGHGGIASPNDRVDCSGYVSAILHAGGYLGSPQVSGALENFGESGKGRFVTVYANGGHVLIEINGRFFATSHSNPGGGPGEISRPSGAYLSSFVARHPKGL